jgi:hypothetical protein
MDFMMHAAAPRDATAYVHPDGLAIEMLGRRDSII